MSLSLPLLEGVFYSNIIIRRIEPFEYMRAPDESLSQSCRMYIMLIQCLELTRSGGKRRNFVNYLCLTTRLPEFFVEGRKVNHHFSVTPICQAVTLNYFCRLFSDLIIPSRGGLSRLFFFLCFGKMFISKRPNLGTKLHLRPVALVSVEFLQ